MICYGCRQDTVEGPRGGVYPSPGIRLCPLHAAALALLEALQAIVTTACWEFQEQGKWSPISNDMLDQARAAIAQAKGETL